jgi:hypothetical protein
MKSVSEKPKVPVKRELVAYLCLFRPEPEGGFTVICPKLPPVVTYGEPWKTRRRTRARRSSCA